MSKKNVYEKHTNSVVPFPTYDVYRSEKDGCIILHIETNDIPEDENGPIIRVYLNDEPLFENPDYPHEIE